jgi:DNA-binding LytR/AlgR family response regulator
MPTIKILAVEDDELHADTLRMIIDRLSYELIDIVDTAAEALRLIRTTHPDVLLMDIDLGAGETGIDLVKKINEIADVPVIYLTTFTSEAVFRQARETLPEAYINKPYSAEQLQTAIELAVFRKQKELDLVRKRSRHHPPTDTVFVKAGTSLVKMHLKDIILVEAYDKYCYVYDKSKKHLLNMPLKTFAQHLPPDQFLQVHRSYVVNLEAVDTIQLQQNTLEIGGHRVPVSKTYKPALLSQLKML